MTPMNTGQSIRRIDPPATSVALPLPLPSLPIRVRAGTLDDIAFMDGLQKRHSRAVGWMPTKTLEGKIKAGHVLIADATNVDEGLLDVEVASSRLSTVDHRPSHAPLGYLIGADRYFKHDDVGIIYAINIDPSQQRGLVGATLLKAQFERSAYGCKLYCCWCAQDLAANKFWEAMGFVPLAFRSGGRGRMGSRQRAEGTEKQTNFSSSSRPTAHRPLPIARTHLFWQTRIRSADASTPWWFPSQTTGGSVREDRLVLPIPPGVRWSDAMPVLLPEEVGVEQWPAGSDGKKTFLARTRSSLPTAHRPLPTPSKHLPLGGPLRFAAPAPVEPIVRKPKPEPRRKLKNNPRHIAMARELRDRYLEQVNAPDAPALPLAARYQMERAADGCHNAALRVEQLPEARVRDSCHPALLPAA